MRRAAIPGLLVLAVLRLPSLMEPHWYTDEAGYLNVARQLLQGKILYLQTWNNKPPLMLWTFALDVKLFGSSEIALHVLTLITGRGHDRGCRVGGVAAVHAAARADRGGDRRGDPRAPDRRRGARAPGEPADRTAHVGGRDHPGAHPSRRSDGRTAAIPMVAARRRGPHGRGDRVPADVRRRDVGVLSRDAAGAEAAPPRCLHLLGTVVAITAAWLAWRSSLPGSAMWPSRSPASTSTTPRRRCRSSAVGGVAHFGLALAATSLIAAGAIASRNRDRVDWVVMLWAGATLVVTAVAGQQYPHFLAPAVAPLTLLVGRAPAAVAARGFAARNWRDILGPGLAGGRARDRDPDGEGRGSRLDADPAVGDQLPHAQRLLRRRGLGGLRPHVADDLAGRFRLPRGRRRQGRRLDHPQRVQR